MLYTRAVPVQPDDLTAKARIREAALELFAVGGVAGTSLRSVAARAGVSPSLVVHHYGTKTRLAEAVEAAVVQTFADAFSAVDLDGPPEDVPLQIEQAISAIIGHDPHTRGYLARSLSEGGPASQRLFDAFVDLIDAGLAHLESAGQLAPGLDPTWRSYTVASVILGPVLFAPRIGARLGVDPFDPDIVRARSACNLSILRRGLFRPDRGSRR